MGTALLALCFCALSLILALFVGISPISDKAKIRFMYVGAALSLMAINTAKPTLCLMPAPLSSRLARSVKTYELFSLYIYYIYNRRILIDDFYLRICRFITDILQLL